MKSKDNMMGVIVMPVVKVILSVKKLIIFECQKWVKSKGKMIVVSLMPLVESILSVTKLIIL